MSFNVCGNTTIGGMKVNNTKFTFTFLYLDDLRPYRKVFFNYPLVHIPDMNLIEAMNASSETCDAGISEVDKLGLETVAFEGFTLPRLKEAKVAYGCELYEIQEIGKIRQSLIFGAIKTIYLDESIIDSTIEGRIKVDATKLNPVARLGTNEYATLSEVITMKRPA